jgi:hypothetical protein
MRCLLVVQVLLYDLRSSKPVQMKDHLYGCPIVDIKYHSSVSSAQRHIISTDTKIVKIWDPATVRSALSQSPCGPPLWLSASSPWRIAWGEQPSCDAAAREDQQSHSATRRPVPRS